MASNDVVVRLVADVGSLTQSMNRAQQEIEQLRGSTERAGSSIDSAFRKIGGVIAGAFAVATIKDFVVNMIEASASVSALDSMFEQTFKGDQAKALEGITSQAKQQNINVDRLKGSWASFYGTFKGNGADANQSLELTSRYMKLAGDGSAYYDQSLEEVCGRLKSITMGNFEAGDAIGLNLNVTKLDTIAKEKYKKKWQELNDTQKEFLILDTAEKIYESSGAMGQGEREANSWSNVLGNLHATWERFLGILGQPALQIATDAIASLTGKLETAITWVKEFAQGFQDTYKSTGDFSESLAKACDTVGLTNLGKAIDTLGDSFDKTASTASNIVHWWSQMGTGATILTGIVASLTVAILAYNASAIASSVASGLETMAIMALYVQEAIATGATTILTGSTTALAVAVDFLTASTTLIVLAIGAIIVACVLLYKNWDLVKAKAGELGGWIGKKWNEIVAWTSKAWNGMVQGVSTAWTGICSAISNGFNSVIQWFVNGWNCIVSACSTAWECIKNVITVGIMVVVSIVSVLFQLITLPIMFVWENIKTYVFQVWEWIKTIVTTGIIALVTAVTTFFTPIIQLFAGIWDSIVSYVQTVWTTISTYLLGVFTYISEIVSAVWGSIVNTFIVVLNQIKTVVSSVWEQVKTHITATLNAIKAVIVSVWDSVKAYFIAVLNHYKALFITVFNAIKSIVISVFQGIKSTITSVWNSVCSVTSSVWNRIYSTVSSIINRVKSTISSVFNGIYSTASSVWNRIKTAMTKPIEEGKNKIASLVEGVKRLFKFTLTFPKPKLPHFSLSGSFSLNPPSVPKLGVNWYKTGGIATGHSIVGVGEAGDEAIVPLSDKHRMKPFAYAVASLMPDVDRVSSEQDAGVAINVESLVVREEADIQRIAQELYKLQQRNSRRAGVI